MQKEIKEQRADKIFTTEHYYDQAKLLDDLKQKKQRTQLKSAEFRMEKTRGDVVFKTILRQMRKSLSDDFNKTTNYFKIKSNFKGNYDPLLDMLSNYITQKINPKKNDNQMNEEL